MVSAADGIAGALARAADLQRDGRYGEAEALYRSVLAEQPDQFDALHMLGVLSLQTGRAESGIALIERAIAADPSVALAHKNLAMGLTNARRDKDALASCDRAVALDPAYKDAWRLRGHVLQKLGRNQDALESYDRALALQPDDLDSEAGRADALHQLGRFEEAVASYEKVVAREPGSARMLVKRGAALSETGRFDDAIESYDKAIASDPEDSFAHYNRGVAFHSLQRWEDAVAAYDRSIALKPDFAGAYGNRGAALFKLDRFQEAVADCDAALALRPDQPQALVTRGIALQFLGRTQEAVDCCDKAIAMDPDFALAHYNRGLALLHLGRRQDALMSFQRALAIRPGYTDVLLSMAHILLSLGEYADGWRYYEWRKRCSEPAGCRTFPQPLWTGQQDLSGKHLFVHWEQGFGDIVQMSRYASIVSARGAQVTMSVPVRMLPLMRGFDPSVGILGGLDAPAAFDFHIPLMSLPMALGTTPETIPAASGYIRADAAAVARWQVRLGPRDRPRVGIVWRGNPSRTYNRIRSIQVADLLPLLDADAQFICLQHELDDASADAVRRDGRIAFLGDAIGDLGETAALVACLDLVISIDTFFAHLAGAMGKPVWVPLPTAPDWRWFLGRQDSPWYPTARLFRQDAPRDWSPVIARMRQELERLGISA